jgi:anaerobic selenocysteine-containing dehydrogenase
MLTRRSFLATTAAAMAAGAFAGESSPRKKIAFIGTVVHEHSHAQHFLDRLSLGYTWGG